MGKQEPGGVDAEGFCTCWEGPRSGKAPSPVSLGLEERGRPGTPASAALRRGLLVPSAASEEGLTAHCLPFPFSLSASRFLVPPSQTCSSPHSRAISTSAGSMTSVGTPSSPTG